MPKIDKRTFLAGSLASVAGGGLASALSAAPSDTQLDRKGQPPFGKPQGQSTGLNLLNPPAARTADSFALLWDRFAGTASTHYDVYLDGKLVATTPFTDHTFHGLRPATAYDVRVRATVPGSSVILSDSIRVTTKRRGTIHNIANFGAVGDGHSLNTAAIQSAIDQCVAGDIVRIPRGVFLSGAIFVKSEMTLHLDAGAILLGSDDPRHYPVMTYRFEGREQPCYASLVNTADAKGGRWHHIAITGQGTIDGNGVALREREIAEKAAERGRAICIRDTDGLYLQGVTVRQSPAWCVHPIYCSGVTINGISIHTKFDETGKPYRNMVNGDGIDPDSCRDVFIFDCDISSEDDGIAIKSGRDAEGRAVGIPSENVRISHCRFTSGFGVAVGSEMAGGVRNVLVEDCDFVDTFSIASVKAPRGRGNVIEHVTYRNCTLRNTSEEHHDGRWFRGALYVDQFYSIDNPDPMAARPKDAGTALIRNIIFKDITLHTVGGNAIYLSGLPESPLQNIRLENVTATGVHGFTAYNIRGLVLDGVVVEAQDGKAMRFVNVMP